METQNNKSPSVGTENHSGINDVSQVQRPSTHSAPTPAAIPDDNNSANPTGDDHQPTEPPTDPNGDDDEESSDREVAFAAIVRRADRETTTPEGGLALVIERSKGPHGRMPNGDRRKRPAAASDHNKLYTNVKNLLANNIELALNHQTDRRRTRKLTYEELTKKPKKEVNWKESIKKKIEKFSQQLQFVTSHKQNEAASRALKRICKATQYHSNNEDQLKKLQDQIEEKRAVITFWRGIWATDDEEGEYQETIDLLDPVELQTKTEEEKVKKVIEEKIKFLPNWKTPRPDVKTVDDPEQIDGRLYMGTTYLIVKTKRASKGKELRSITCLPNIYKLLSKVVTALVTDLCEVNELISANQMGTRRGCQGAKQQILLNKVLNQKHNNGLFTSWIDIQKAYDSVKHDYLVAVLTKLGMPENIIKFVKRTLAFQRTSLVCHQSDIGQVRINKGLLQGDSLSSLLFVLALEPLSRRLNQNCEQLQMGNIELNHLIFIDDIKLLADTEETLIRLCGLTKKKKTVCQMGLKVNLQKSASNVGNNGVFGGMVDDHRGYKYLGTLKDSRNVVKDENKAIVTNKATERMRMLCKTKLNAANLSPTFQAERIRTVDKEVRKILNEYKVTRNAANMYRLYLKRDQLGRGLACVEEKADIMLFKMLKSFEKNPKTRPLMDQEKEGKTQLRRICDYLKAKYRPEETKLTEKNIQKNRKKVE
ncbi:uncharacterized protein LOC120844471 [Ixodes scapularis]|uniref:uncharacterized protein LOC120844471 n=1 Tax=Ixodes scapularis TaxID=6945 RepID=UPI001A9FD1B1|nr:uncharacterized protein LOC120844471 [Ixodes scapularis]